MPRPIDTSKDAVWKQRFRAPSIWVAAIAPQAPDRGMVWTNQSGTLQFHTWDVPSGSLKQLTFTPGGQNTFLHLSPDGRWAYYLKDDHGNEIGHYVRIPYEGGEPEDITPDMDPYPSFAFTFSRQGNRLGFTTAAPDGFRVFLMDVNPDGSLGGAPRMLYHMKTMGFGPVLSADGRLAVIMTSEHSGKNEFALKCFDAETGQEIAELWDGDGTSVEINDFSPVPGDVRLLATSNRSGFEACIVVEPADGRADGFTWISPGRSVFTTWAVDGNRVIVCGLHQAVQSVHLSRSLPAKRGG